LAFALLLSLAWATPALADPSGKNPAKSAETSDLPTLLFVFMLASFIGLGVITRVSRLLHTPLMSLTNAISAIAVVGAIAVTGHVFLSDGKLSYLNILGAIALFASMTNIVSGFLLTDRMVKMFKTQEGKRP
jgi:NAD(P) transhydrogenase subunit alpha